MSTMAITEITAYSGPTMRRLHMLIQGAVGMCDALLELEPEEKLKESAVNFKKMLEKEVEFYALPANERPHAILQNYAKFDEEGSRWNFPDGSAIVIKRGEDGSEEAEEQAPDEDETE